MSSTVQNAPPASSRRSPSGLLNGWPLFWFFVIPMNGAMLWAMAEVDLTTPAGVSAMIQYSVRWAVPFIYLVVAASAMPTLFPSKLSFWMLRNRRYIGLIFAVAMAWQGAFIFTVSSMHTGYYYSDIYLLRDELEGSSGYLFLAAMVFTSFSFGRRLLSAAQWKTLHRSGVYFLWAYPFSVYWWNLYYYKTGAAIDYLFYWAGFFAFAARIAAWGKRRWSLRELNPGAAQQVLRSVGLALVAIGLLASLSGLHWQAMTSSFLTATPWSAQLELWLPFWPFEPFLPLMAMGIGTWLCTGVAGSLQTPDPLRSFSRRGS